LENERLRDEVRAEFRERRATVKELSRKEYDHEIEMRVTAEEVERLQEQVRDLEEQLTAA